MAVVVLLGLVAVLGIREGARLTKLLVAVKALVCVFVLGVGAFFAYTEFEAVADLGEETRRPARDLPLGLLGTLGICALLSIERWLRLLAWMLLGFLVHVLYGRRHARLNRG